METAMAARPIGDLLSQLIGSSAFSRGHRFPDLRLPGPFSVGPASLAVSRYYFEARVVVDVIAVSRRDEKSILAKRRFCKANGLRYLLLADPHDEQAIRDQLAESAAALRPPEARAAEAPAVPRPVAQKRRRTTKPTTGKDS